MKHVLLDVNIVLDLWLERGEYCLIEELLEENFATEVKFWLSAGSLPVIEYIFIRELKKEGLKKETAIKLAKKLFSLLLIKVQLLSNNGFDQAHAIENAYDLEDAQIALALNCLHGNKKIVTSDSRFDTLGLVDSCTPSEVLAWIRTDQSDTSTDQLINFIDLKTQQDTIRPQLEKNIHTVLNHGRYILGPEVKELENQLIDYTKAKHCITVSSGTDSQDNVNDGDLTADVVVEVIEGDGELAGEGRFEVTDDEGGVKADVGAAVGEGLS